MQLFLHLLRGKHRFVTENQLRVYFFLPAAVHLFIGTVRLQNAGLFGVLQFDIQNMQRLRADRFIFQRENNLHTSVQIPRHPVCGAGVYLRLSSVLEIEDSGMLEEIADNAAHRNIIRNSADTHLKAADTAHNQLNLHTGCRGLIQRLDNIRITQRIHLGLDLCALSAFCVFRFPPDHVQETVFEPEGRENQLIPGSGLRITGQHIKDCGCVFSKRLLAGEQAYIGIKPCCRIIIVSGRQMHIPADTVFFPAHNQCDFRMRLKPYKAIDNMAACLLQHFSPADIVLFIKSCLELDQHGYLFAVVGSPRKRGDNR